MAINFIQLGVLLVLFNLVPPWTATSDKSGLSSVCNRIIREISSESAVFPPGDPTYIQDISHFVVSSSQNSSCSVEPGTAEDVGKILRIVGATRTPFAVKGGGHASNPHFSSTSGVQISMARFTDVKYNPTIQTATIGAGSIWDDVYLALEPYNVSVAGGRVAGIGVAGFTLGGGYSWKTNQHGLAIDTVVAYELVVPSGAIINVTKHTNPDLFFGLRGGGNNFGIVTQFTFKTFPQTLVWGGAAVSAEPSISAASAATAKFYSQVKDPKAAVILTYAFVQGQPLVGFLLFYDAPTPPAGIFDDFLALPTVTSDINTRTIFSLVHSASQDVSSQRGVYNSIPIFDVTLELLDFIANEAMTVGQELSRKSGTTITYSPEPFLSNILQHSTSPSAYPPQRSVRFLPFDLNYFWTDPHFDQDIFGIARQSAARIKSAAIAMGQKQLRDATLYPNYAIFGTPLEDMYGSNVQRLKAIKENIDPFNVMGLAGGFKF